MQYKATIKIVTDQELEIGLGTYDIIYDAQRAATNAVAALSTDTISGRESLAFFNSVRKNGRGTLERTLDKGMCVATVQAID